MTREEFKARVSMSYGDPMTWDQHLEAVWQLHLKASNHWISVEEELPKVQDWYLCYNDIEDGPEVLHWEGDGNVWMDNDWHYKSNVVTHWMPLPAAPRKEE